MQLNSMRLDNVVLCGLRFVDAINASRVSAGRFTFRVLSRRQFRRFRSSFLKERGRSSPRLGLPLLVLELPGPGWARRSGRRSRGSGGARPRSGRRGLDGGAVRRIVVKGREIEKGLVLPFGLGGTR